MSQHAELIERLREDARQMRATGLVKEGALPLAEEAATALAALVEENAEGLEVLAEFKAELAKLAETDPEISDADRKRLVHQGAAARYREMAFMSFRESVAWERGALLPRLAPQADQAAVSALFCGSL